MSINLIESTDVCILMDIVWLDHKAQLYLSMDMVNPLNSEKSLDEYLDGCDEEWGNTQLNSGATANGLECGSYKYDNQLIAAQSFRCFSIPQPSLLDSGQSSWMNGTNLQSSLS